MLRGVLHVHSTYSDGEFSLAELRAALGASGCQFICMNDHAEYFDEEKLAAYSHECEMLSDQSLLVIPGLEYTCREGMHVLGYGSESLADTDDPERIFEQIARAGGVSAIAHPWESAFARIKSFTVLPDGIEAWNAKYDGRYAPRPAVFELFRCLRERKQELRAFYGIDLHWRSQFRDLFVELSEGRLERRAIIDSLRAGKASGRKADLCLGADGKATSAQLTHFRNVHLVYDVIRRSANRATKLGRRMGIGVPASLKRQLRRVF